MKKSEYNFFKFFLVILPILLITFNLQAWIVFNGSQDGFDEEYQEELEEEILMGASSFLSSYSEILNLFQRIEMKKLVQLEFDELKMFVNNAVLRMEIARDAYIRLNEKATRSSYNFKVINKLVVFDFEKFQIQRGLNKEKFSEVASFLKYGDVRGIYLELLTKVEALLSNLYTVKNTIDSGSIPDVSLLWNLNSQYTRTLTFGQQVANVFYKVTGK